MTASSKARHSEANSAAESARDAAVSEVGMVSSAAKKMLQTLAKQHSCKCQPIFSSTHIQQLLQPCLNAFCQPETARLKGSAPVVKDNATDAEGAVKGSAPAVKGSASDAKGSIPAVKGSASAAKGYVLAVQGNASDAKGSAAVEEGSPPLVEGTRLSSGRQCLPVDAQMLDGHVDAADMSAHDWHILRYKREYLLERQRMCSLTHTHMYTRTHARKREHLHLQKNLHNVCSRKIQNLMYSFLLGKQCFMLHFSPICLIGLPHSVYRKKTSLCRHCSKSLGIFMPTVAEGVSIEQIDFVQVVKSPCKLSTQSFLQILAP